MNTPIKPWYPDQTRNIGIVIQGPVGSSADFLYGTLDRYRHMWPFANVVVSTWDDESPEVLRNLERMGVSTILSQDPGLSGGLNLNRQIVSTRAGVDFLRRQGCAYVLKTRTDCRIYNERTLGALVSLLWRFPVAGSGSQQQRIIGSSLNTFLFRLYGLSDIFLFGAIEDMSTFWNVSLDSRDSISLDSPNSHREHSLLRTSEVYLASSFLEKTGWPLRWTLDDSLNAFQDRFIVVDNSSIDLLWRKYTVREDRWNSTDSSVRTAEMTFFRWLTLDNLRQSVSEALLDESW